MLAPNFVELPGHITSVDQTAVPDSTSRRSCYESNCRTIESSRRNNCNKSQTGQKTPSRRGSSVSVDKSWPGVCASHLQLWACQGFLDMIRRASDSKTKGQRCGPDGIKYPEENKLSTFLVSPYRNQAGDFYTGLQRSYDNAQFARLAERLPRSACA